MISLNREIRREPLVSYSLLFESLLYQAIYFTDPKPTLKEELFAEKEEAWREKKYEDSLTRRAKVMS